MIGKYEDEMKSFRNEFDEKINIILSILQTNPQLTMIKIPVLKKKLKILDHNV